MSTATEGPQIARLDWIMVGVLGFVWGSTFMVTELALEGMTPFWVAFIRLAFAALPMVVIWRLRGGRLALDPDNPPKLRAVALAGALSSAIPFLLLSWAQQFVTSGLAGTAMAAVTLIVLPLAHFLVPGERLTGRKALGVLVGFGGVLLLIGGDAFASTGAQLETWGRIACLGAAVCYAVNAITIRRLPPIDPMGLTAMMMLFAALIVLPVALIFEGVPPLPDARTLAALLTLGLVSTAAMNLLRVLVIRRAGPSFLTLVNYQVPLWSVVMGVVILLEPVPPTLLSALVLILAGVALSQWQALRVLVLRRRRPGLGVTPTAQATARQIRLRDSD